MKFQNVLRNGNNGRTKQLSYDNCSYFPEPLYERTEKKERERERQKERRREDSLTFSVANKKHGRRGDNGCRILCPARWDWIFNNAAKIMEIPRQQWGEGRERVSESSLEDRPVP